jgi:NAD(P)-dependent dehydrogenase (short-subunit alcohol dehydrogenase family)
MAGQVAVVTGGGSGIGLAIARRLGASGLKVLVADVEAGALDSAVQELQAAGVEVRGRRCDVSNANDVEALAAATFDAFGSADVVCLNAGVVTRGKAWEQSLADWEWVLGVDLWGVIHGVRSFVPRMLASGRPGHIVNTASMAGLAAFSRIAPYNVAKAGVVALSETLHHEFRVDRAPIGVSVLCPGLVATRIGQSERNRPGADRTTVSPGPVSMRNPGAEAMTADEVAEHVVNAIESEQFWVLTHPAYDDVIRQRADGILGRRDVVEPQAI